MFLYQRIISVTLKNEKKLDLHNYFLLFLTKRSIKNKVAESRYFIILFID
jgi:hypothetical protein